MSKRTLSVWQIRAFLVFFVLFSLVSVLTGMSGIIFNIIAFVLILLLLLAVFVYYPLKYYKLSYENGGEFITIHSGVIYTRQRIVYKSSIKYVTLLRTPLQRMFGISTLMFNLPGLIVYIPGLSHTEAKELYNRFSDMQKG